MRALVIKDMRPSSEHPMCLECGLWKGLNHPFQCMTGSSDPEILVVTAAPPFVGHSNESLRDSMARLGMNDNAAYITVARCHPPRSKLPVRCAKLCINFLYYELAQLNPKLIMALGITASRAIMDTDRLPPDWAEVAYESYSDLKRSVMLLAWHPVYMARKPNLLGAWRSKLRLASGLV